MVIQRARPSVLEILDRVLDKGIVIDAWVNVMLVGIDLVTVDARVVVASLETYLKYADTLNDDRPGRPSTVNRRTSRSGDVKAADSLLPDCHFTIEGAIARGEDVLVSWLATGTPRDQYSGANLTARPLRVPGCTVTRLRDKKIVHTWNYWDTPAYSS